MSTQQLPKTIFPFILHFIRPHKWKMTLFALAMIISGLDGVVRTYLLKIIIDTAEMGAMNQIGWAILGLAVVYECHNLSWRACDYINYQIQPIIRNSIITQTLSQVYKHSNQFFQDHFSGSIANNINMLADNIEIIVHDISRFMIRNFLLLILSFFSMYWVHPIFCWILLIWSTGFIGISFCFSRKIIGFSEHYAETQSDASGQLVDSLGNMQNIRLFSKRTYEINRLETFLWKTKMAFKNQWRFLLKFYYLQGLSITITIALMAWVLVQLKSEGLVTAGDFVLIIGLMLYLGDNIWWTTEQIDRMNNALGKCNQALSALLIQIDVTDKHNAPDILVKQGGIVFDNVQFNYKNMDLLFHQKSVSIQPGEKIGLVGYSGGGKSTFVHLILRLYDVTGGHILIDGQDIREVTQDSLRASIGMIPQDPSLFHRSLSDNIRYGQVDASMEEIVEAAKKAHAHEFIIKLPEGYDSLVGEHGVKLSGGQRQRIAIARAILKNAPILILDEATSQLDSVTERDIQDSLWSLMQDKTTIVIAHRLSTLLHMDRILVFNQGEIVEEGAHQALLEKQGLYKTLWDAQVGGFLPD